MDKVKIQLKGYYRMEINSKAFAVSTLNTLAITKFTTTFI